MPASPDRFLPRVAWETATPSPLVGLVVAAEDGTAVLWDSAGTVVSISRAGVRLGTWQSKSPLRAAGISADGQVVAAASADGTVHLLNPDLSRLRKFRSDDDPIALALDPNGWHVVVSTASGNTALYDALGRVMARLDFLRALRYLHFVVAKPALIGCSEEGMLAAFNLKGEQLWRVASAARVGGLACDARARKILVPAFSAGLLTFDGRGESLPSAARVDHPSRVAMSPLGAPVVIASLDQSVSLQSRDGLLQRLPPLESPVVAVGIDPFGRQAWVGLEVGRVLCLDLRSTGSSADDLARETAGASGGAAGVSASIEPTWQLELGLDTDRLTGASLKILDQPLRIGLLSSDKLLRVYVPGAPTQRLKPHHVSGPLEGIGRILLAGQGRLVALSDRRVLVYDAVTNKSHTTEARLVEVTHAQLCGLHELFVIEERERLSRRWLDGRRVWECELPALADQLAVGRDRLAVALDDGSLWLAALDGTDQRQIQAQAGQKHLLAPLGPGFVVVGLEDSTARWIAPDGQVLVERELPRPIWSLTAVGPWVVARAADGRSWRLDTDAHLREIAPPPQSEAVFYAADGGLARVYEIKGCVTCATADGQILWRHIHSQPLGSLDANAAGTAFLLGGRLCWFAGQGA